MDLHADPEFQNLDVGFVSIALDSAEEQAASIPAGPITSREEAIRQLNNISSFFRQTEPHSPISYVIDKAVKWGDMSLSELISELIPDSSSRETYSSLTGVNANEE